MFLFSPALFLPLSMTPPRYQALAQSLSLSLTMSQSFLPTRTLSQPLPLSLFLLSVHLSLPLTLSSLLPLAPPLPLPMPLSLPLPRSLSLSLSLPQTLPMLTQCCAPDGALPPPPFVAPRDQNSGAAKTPLMAHLCVVLLALLTVNSP